MLIAGRISIPSGELKFEFITGGGPGGQHVNKVSTAVRLRFNVLTSPSLPDEDRRLMLERLKDIVDDAGFIAVTSREERSQYLNRRTAELKLMLILEQALYRPRRRLATRPTRASVLKRLEVKRLDSERKRRRRRPELE